MQMQPSGISRGNLQRPLCSLPSSAYTFTYFLDATTRPSRCALFFSAPSVAAHPSHRPMHNPTCRRRPSALDRTCTATLGDPCLSRSTFCPTDLAFFSFVSTPKFSEQDLQENSPVARSCLQASAARNSLRHRVLLPAAGTGWVGFPRKRPLEIKHARKTPADLISAVGCNMSCARVLFFSLPFFSGATPA